MGVRFSPGSLLMAAPSLGSATAKDAFFSSLRVSKSFASMGETFPSTSDATSSKAVAAESNFSKCFNLRLCVEQSNQILVTQFSLGIEAQSNTTYSALIPSAVSTSADSFFFNAFLSALKRAKPALVSVRTKRPMVKFGE